MADLFDDMFEDDDLSLEDIMFNDIDGQGSEAVTNKPTKRSHVKHIDQNPAPLMLAIAKSTIPESLPNVKVPLPMTVMGRGGKPVIVQDAARFRKDIQTMVMAQMTAGMVSEEEFEELKTKGTMIEIATVNLMRQAAEGDQRAYECMMDRVLGKAVNQTKSVNMSVSYEEILAQCNPDDEVVPDDIIDVDIIGKT